MRTSTAAVSTLPELEPLLSDWEVSVVEDRLRKRMRYVPDQTRFVTFIQEPIVAPGPDGELHEQDRLAIFGCLSPHPTSPWAPDIMTYGATKLSDFEAARAEQEHYVKGDLDNPAMVIFGAVLRNHISTLNTIRDIIH
jgi:hypothetical protein